MAQRPHQSGVGLQQQVFISHTAADGQGRCFAANVLKPALDAAGIVTYIDYNNLQLGCEWTAELVQAATSSAVFVAVLTRSYATRFWCLRELDLALNRLPGSPQPLLIPVYIDHHSKLKTISPDELRTDIERRISKLSTAADSAAAADELRDLERLVSNPAHLQRMVKGNLVSLQSLQSVRRQHQEPQQLQGQQQQQQQLLLQELPASETSESDEFFDALSEECVEEAQVPAPKDEEWQLAYRVVLAALPRLPRLAHVPEGILGYEEELATLAARVAPHKPGILGSWLHGPGGFGKTTMANLLWNVVSNQILKKARITLDLDGSSSGELHDKLTSLLQQLGVPEPNSGDMHMQLQRLSDFVERHNVLLLYDNVNHVAQLDALLPTSFSEGSRVIITSRLERLDRTSKAYQALVAAGLHHHKMLGLKDAAAQELFRQQHTLQQAELKRLHLIDWETDLIAACSGLPLALLVIGAALAPHYCKSDDDTVKRWKEMHAFCEGMWTAAGRFDTAIRLQDVVYSTFHTLSPAAQNIFLDCVSVLHLESYSEAMMVWEAWWPTDAHQAFDRLQQLSLVTRDDDNKVTVLDVLRSLGQSIILTKDRPERLGSTFTGSRIWVAQDGTVKVAAEGSRPVAVGLPVCILDGPPLEGWDLSELRIFLSHAPAPHVLLDAPKLLWLSTRDTESDSAAGACSNLGNPLSGSNKELHYSLWSPEVRHCLCNWELQWDLVKLPGGHQLQNLVRLTLIAAGYWNIGRGHGWRMVVDAIGKAQSLPALQFFELDARMLDHSNTDGMQALACAIGNSSKLQDLTLGSRGYVSNSSKLPGKLWVPAIAKLQALTSLRICGSPGADWAELLAAVGQLTRLKVLDIPDPGNLPELPQHMSKLEDLQQLHMNNWTGLRGLPEWFGNLHKLQKLSMISCWSLTSLPASFGGLSDLQELHLKRCDSLEGLPTSFGDLRSLTKLSIYECLLLRLSPSSVSGLINLQELRLDHAAAMETCYLPELFGRLVNLHTLNMSEWDTLYTLPRSFGGLVLLTELDLSGCRGLESLPESIGHLTALQTLILGWCLSFAALPKSIGGLSSLQRLVLARCALRGLPESLTTLVRLTWLDLSSCEHLTTLPAGFAKLPSLEVLRLRGCTSLDIDAGSLLQLPALSLLQLSGCTQLTGLPDTWPGTIDVFLP